MSGLSRRGQRGPENVEGARSLIRALAGDDPRTVLESLDPEVELVTARPLAGAGRFHGPPGFVRWFERWEAAWERESLWVAMVEPVGRRHVVALTMQRPRASGPEAAATADGTPISWVFELRDGCLARIHAYAEREAAIGAARAGEGEPAGPPPRDNG